MNEPVKFTPKFPEHIDSTIRSDFKACPWKCYQTRFRGVASPYLSEHLHFGQAFASGCKATRNAFYRDGLGQVEAINIGLEEILSFWGDFEPPERSVKNLNNCLDTFDIYFSEAYPLNMSPIIPYQLSEDSAPIVENTFAIPLPLTHPETGNPLLFAGRADMVGVFNSACEGKPWTASAVWDVDEKTTGSMGASWANQWRQRGQFMGYTWANRMNGLPSQGTIVRGICVYKKRKPEFQEAIIQPSQAMIDRWYRQLLADVNEMISCWESGYWDYNLASSCGNYGGCGMLKVCEMDDPEPFIQSNYVERRWNPLAAEGE